jgi:hypothetical protein
MKRSTGLSGRFQAAGLLAAVTCILLTASPASAATITVFHNIVDFQDALSSFSPTDTFNDLIANTQFADQDNNYVGVPLLRTNGAFQYTVDAPNDSLFTTDTAPDVALSTTSALSNIEFSLFSPGINAVGGNFFPTAVDFSVIPGVITFTFNGDTTQTVANPLGTDFIGFISDVDISSFLVGVNVANPDSNSANSADIFAAVDNLTVGSTPEPQSVLLLLGGLAAGALRLRRRNAQAKA